MRKEHEGKNLAVQHERGVKGWPGCFNSFMQKTATILYLLQGNDHFRFSALGYYIYVSNEAEQKVDIYFDDMKIVQWEVF